MLAAFNMANWSVIDWLIVIPVLPLIPVLATWFLPWEDWLPKKIPKIVLGPYLLYAAFSAWHFGFDAWIVFFAIAMGLGVLIAGVVERIS
jgi:hypothetical protein